MDIDTDTVIPIREYVDIRLIELEKNIVGNFKAHEREHELMEQVRVVDKEGLDKHLSWLNEMRGALRDERAERDKTFSRVEHEAYAKVVEVDLRILRENRAEMQGKASQSNLNVTFFIACFGILVTFFNLILHFIYGH